MKFLKKSQINFRNVKDNSIAVQVNGEITLDSTNAVLIPKGTTLQRPVGSNGQMRYNITTNEFEFFQSGQWKSVSYNESSAVTQQEFIGDNTDTFGPLSPIPSAAQNILVFVDSVFQSSTNNYSVSGSNIVFSESIPNGSQIIVLHGFAR